MTTGGTTLTYLFTDLEGSTRLWERHPEAMHGALSRHDAILRAAVEECRGTVVKTTGDGLMAVFGEVADAVTASIEAQRALAAEPWGEPGSLRVRMGMHLGESRARAGDYYGTDVNRAARVMAAAHGGQVLLSAPVAAAVLSQLPAASSLRDLGTHRLKDLAGPEHLYQLVAPGLVDVFPPLATLDVRPNNLPTQTSAFLGRETVLDELRAMLDTGGTRLVTLTGPGGTGKTRLALQAAAEQIDRFADGVFFVDLSTEREPEAAFATIVRSIAIGGAGEDPPLEVLKRGLRDLQMLLVLDNFEQVTAAAIGVIALLEACPGVTALVTSREALRVRGEQLYPVPPLSLPDVAGPDMTVPDALASEAVRLFVDRAAAIRPDFTLTTDSVDDVVAICVRLDGLPLAIELAAARVNLFGLAELRSRLDRRLDVLRGGARDLPQRQQTLRGAIEWSNELLDEDERAALRMFSVFVGARLVDVEATVARLPSLARLDVAELVGSLVDKSLVRSTTAAEGRPRFAMLRTIQDYAAEELQQDPGFAAAVQDAHAQHYTEVAVDLRRRLVDTDRDEVLAALSAELGNFRAAWAHWATVQDVAAMHELLEPLWGYYDARGEYGAAVELADDLLAVLRVQPETVERVREEIAVEMSLARSLIAVRGYTAEVERTIRAVLDRSGTAGDTGDGPQRFPVLRSLATLHMLQTDYVRGLEVGRELLSIAERQGDPMLLSEAHLVFGINTAFGEDFTEGVRHLDESIRHFEAARSGLVRFRVGPIPGVVSLVVSGLMLWMLGFPDRATERVRRALALSAQLGHPYSRAYALFHGAVLHVWEQDLAAVSGLADELLTVANANDYPIWRALGMVMRGTARIGAGDHEAGLAEVDRGFALYDGLTTPPVFWPLLLVVRGMGRAMAGRVEEALAFVDEAEAALTEGDPQVADFAVIRGNLLLALPTPDAAAAETNFGRAWTIAQQADTRMTALQAATGLAALHRGTDREQASMANLRDYLAGFTGGVSSPPLVAARAILEG